MDKPTKGPWEVTATDDLQLFVQAVGDDEILASVGPSLENARLMAAAPELVCTLWQWLELAERTMEDHVLRLDANRAADFAQGIREAKAVLAKLEREK